MSKYRESNDIFNLVVTLYNFDTLENTLILSNTYTLTTEDDTYDTQIVDCTVG